MTAVKSQKEKRLRKGYKLKVVSGALKFCHKYRDNGEWIYLEWTEDEIKEVFNSGKWMVEKYFSDRIEEGKM